MLNNVNLYNPVRRIGVEKPEYYIWKTSNLELMVKSDNIENMALEIYERLKGKGFTYAEAVMVLGRTQEILDVSLTKTPI